MASKRSELEKIFDHLCQKYDLLIGQEDNKRLAQGGTFSLEFETINSLTRIGYLDRVISADFYDEGDTKSLSYTIISVYEQCQETFLGTQNSNLARDLLEELSKDHAEVDRIVTRINLDNFSESEEFLSDHIDNY